MDYQQSKRLLDITLALLLMVLFLPFWIVVPILILLDTGRPIFYKHKRLGQYGKEFYLWKFRSMVTNADAILHEQDPALLAKFKAMDWKMPADQDPRITKLGKILRVFTIDEFPQLYNVLRGEMSMIGPRAYLARELAEQSQKYPETKDLLPIILSVKPGITGPWQTSGRNDIAFDTRARLDADYAVNATFWTDLKIIFKTPMAMLSKW
jgi:lipopolysaccharide/colanic/teichoic acid biosynthesis glycosyltransferase